MNLIARINIDTSKPDISTLRLFLKKEFIIYFVIPPSLISIFLGFVAISLSLQIDPMPIVDRSTSQNFSLLMFGYVWCAISAFLSTKILYSKNFSYSIYRPRTIINALGVSSFCSYFIGAIVVRSIFPLE
ncbi:MAG: hypothetical protein KAT16_09805, partial [Candidatus Heimdallarchaeota archaeon]|nr:hypothetical protein [Candidatus Heimdallarchaeota archaeon]